MYGPYPRQPYKSKIKNLKRLGGDKVSQIALSDRGNPPKVGEWEICGGGDFFYRGGRNGGLPFK